PGDGRGRGGVARIAWRLPVGPWLLGISRRLAIPRRGIRRIGRAWLTRLARIAARGSRVLGHRRGGVLLLALGRVARRGTARRWRRQGVAAIGADLGAWRVPGGAAIRTRCGLVGLHSCAAALPMQLAGWGIPFGQARPPGATAGARSGRPRYGRRSRSSSCS